MKCFERPSCGRTSERSGRDRSSLFGHDPLYHHVLRHRKCCTEESSQALADEGRRCSLPSGESPTTSLSPVVGRRFTQVRSSFASSVSNPLRPMNIRPLTENERERSNLDLCTSHVVIFRDGGNALVLDEDGTPREGPVYHDGTVVPNDV